MRESCIKRRNIFVANFVLRFELDRAIVHHCFCKYFEMSGPLVYEKPEGDVAEYLNEYFTNAFRTGYVKCKGFMLPNYFQNFGDSIREMEIRPDDVWVCSMPKAGTTWTQEMVWCIMNKVDLEAAKELLIQRRFPFLENSPLFDYRDLMAQRPEMEFPEYFLDSVGYVNRFPSPRFVKSHLPFTLLPEKLQRNETTAKIVYVARNSRDTCVSYYHHCKLLEGYKGDFEVFCKLFLSGAVTFGPFWEHVLGYWQQKDNPNVLFLTYEEMKEDLGQVICKTTKFLGRSLSEEQVDKLIDHLSFANMKNNRAVNYESAIETKIKYKLMEADGTFMRYGKVGEWKEIMSPTMVERFKQWDQEHIKAANYPFV